MYKPLPVVHQFMIKHDLFNIINRNFYYFIDFSKSQKIDASKKDNNKNY